MAQHSLRASPDTVRIGVFDATFPPVLTIESGDRVVVQCVSGRPDVMPPTSAGLPVPPELNAIIAANPGMRPGHIVTGPIAIAGAEPGDMLEIRIETIEPGADWGYNMIRPLAGTLPEDFHETVLSHIPVDRARRVCLLPWGTELPLAPFFGVMGVAPPPAFGTIASKEPRIHGGNMDNKELVAGSILYLPVWVPGPISRLVTATACRAMERSALPRWRCASPAPSPSYCTKVAVRRARCSGCPRQRRRPTSSAWG